MGLKTYLAFVILFISGIGCWSQDSIQEIIYETHTEYIETFPNRITARLFYVNTSNTLRVNERNSSLYYNIN